MSGQRVDRHASGGRGPRPVLSALALTLLAACNSILGLEASTLQEGSSTGTAGSSSSTSATASTSPASSTSASSGSGGEGGESATTGSGGAGGGDAGGSGGGGADPCGAGTWGLLENGGFECGLGPWASSDGAAQLETFTPGFGDRGTAARFRTPGVDNPVYQPLGQVELEASTCLVASYAAGSSDGSGEIAASLVLTNSPGYFLRGPQRDLGTGFVHHGPLACRIPEAAANGTPLVGTWSTRFTFDVASLSDGATASIDSVVASLEPCAGGEPECIEP